MSESVVLILALLFVLLALGVHVGLALGFAGAVGIYMVAGEVAVLGQLAGGAYQVTAAYTLAVIPMFVLMGAFFNESGLIGKLYNGANAWLGNLRGGVVATTIGASGVFGALTGSSVANAAVFSRVAIPEMLRVGVSKRMAAGSVIAAGTVSSMIPPSVLLVIYGVITETSVAALLVAGILPGILSLLMFYWFGVYLPTLRNPSLAPKTDIRVTWRDKFAALKPVGGAILIFGMVMGSIYTGTATATQAGAVGAAAALALGVTQRKLTPAAIWSCFEEAARVTGTLLLIMIGGIFFARFLSYSGLVREMTESMMGLGLPDFVYLLIFLATLILLGMFLEAYSMMVVVLPLMIPLLLELGYNPIWLGILAVKAAEIGLMTPPLGLVVYVVKTASPVPYSLGELFRSAFPFAVIDLGTLTLLVLFPAIALFLPGMMAN